MKTLALAVVALAATLFTGCQTIPPGAERGPHNTMAYTVLIEATEPGARIEANGEYMGETPLNLKVFGDPDGTFHDFGSLYFSIKAMPQASNHFAQARFFRTGRGMTPEDRIPQRIFFDMTQRMPDYPSGGPPAYYEPPIYYGPTPFFYGPAVRFHFGPRHHHRRW
jgi:hypothetical protein